MDGLKAVDYLKEVVSVLEEFNIMTGLFFIATDGAPSVCSENNGLYGLLKKGGRNHILANKCFAHKTALVAKDLAKEFAIIDKMNHMVYKLCSFFHSKNRLDMLDLNYMQILNFGEETNIL